MVCFLYLAPLDQPKRYTPLPSKEQLILEFHLQIYLLSILQVLAHKYRSLDPQITESNSFKSVIDLSHQLQTQRSFALLYLIFRISSTYPEAKHFCTATSSLQIAAFSVLPLSKAKATLSTSFRPCKFEPFRPKSRWRGRVTFSRSNYFATWTYAIPTSTITMKIN